MDLGPLAPLSTATVSEPSPLQNLELTRPLDPRLYAPLASHDSGAGEYLRILIKRKWVVVTCLVAIFSIVAIATLKTTPVYEAGGTIAINKPDTTLNFQNSGFTLDYYDPTELDTEVKILQSDLLAMQVIRELNLDHRPEFSGQAPPPASASLDLAPDPLQSDPARASAMVGSFKSNLRVALSPNTRIIEVHFRSPDPQMAATVVNTLMQTYVENNFKARFESTMQASDWLSKQLVDLQMKVETSQQKLVRYQKEHEILGTDEKQNIITAKLDALNKELTSSESDRMDKEALYRLVESGDPDAIASSAGGLQGSSGQSASQLLDNLRSRQADLKIQAAELSTQFGPLYPKLTQMNNQLQEIDQQMQAEMKKIASKLRGQYTTALQRENMLHDALEKQKQEANKLNESAIEYTLLKRDVDTNRQLYEGLLQKLKEAGVSAGLKSNNFRIVDVARTPAAPIEPNIPRNLLFAVVLGLASGIGLAFVLEAFDNTVRTTEQAQTI